jgi:multidrug efflux pump
MLISDLSIKRPVLATVVSLLLIVLGLFAFTRLPLRELPDIDPPVVSINTSYTGASAAVVETRITQVLEDAVSGIEGVDLLTSNSRTGRSSINIEFSTKRDIESAANDVRDAVSRVLDNLPDDVDTPRVAKADADSEVILWANVTGTGWDTLALTDYADRYLVDRLSSIDGVAQVNLAGGQTYAMRVWPDPAALAARKLSVSDVQAALRRENIELPGGQHRVDRPRLHRAHRTRLPVRAGVRAAAARARRDGHVVRLGEWRAWRWNRPSGAATSAATARTCSAWASSRPRPRTACRSRRTSRPSSPGSIPACPRAWRWASPTISPSTSTSPCTRSTRPCSRRSRWCWW